ncbi:hypothetical protein Vadar_028755 [Vaccinium darrowii]|uniref:Uncharacterized protein n=1 Tax=Vaccinium darrowii TaxID=229202 RepID=A0ACB7X575_9ERIC|nr:hypothetical protein Vadar_028755 [Vaccinium darrowii]
MGICASSQTTRGEGGGVTKWPPTAKVIDLEGGLQEFIQPIRAGQILYQNPNCFLCSSETMFLGSRMPQVPNNEELQLGQIYFLIPISKSQTPLTLPDLCALAIKASSALTNSVFSDKNGPVFRTEVRRDAEIPASFEDGFSGGGK